MNSSGTLQEQPAIYGMDEPVDCTPVSEETRCLARETIKAFHECFWWRNESAPIATRDDVREIVRTLRMSGGHRAWWAAQKLHKCL